MPIEKEVNFIAIDEIQMCADKERGHIFTDRLLNLGEKINNVFRFSSYEKYNSRFSSKYRIYK